jgi:hypothetical protein
MCTIYIIYNINIYISDTYMHIFLDFILLGIPSYLNDLFKWRLASQLLNMKKV